MIRLLALFSLLVFSPSTFASVVKIIPQESSVSWEGRKVAGTHTGTLQLKSGALRFKNKKLIGGEFVVDMTSLKDEDVTDPSYNAKLVNHLKSSDFFSVANHPTSTFTITKVEPGDNENEYNVTGNLLIKGISRKLTFPATVEEENGKTRASATFEVDRTQFNIKYRSASFFEGLGDKVIKDKFSVSVNLQGNRR